VRRDYERFCRRMRAPTIPPRDFGALLAEVDGVTRARSGRGRMLRGIRLRSRRVDSS
jgi:hypothetical protein